MFKLGDIVRLRAEASTGPRLGRLRVVSIENDIMFSGRIIDNSDWSQTLVGEEIKYWLISYFELVERRPKRKMPDWF